MLVDCFRWRQCDNTGKWKSNTKGGISNNTLSNKYKICTYHLGTVFEISAGPVARDKQIFVRTSGTFWQFFIISHYTIYQSIVRASKFFMQILNTVWGTL